MFTCLLFVTCIGSMIIICMMFVCIYVNIFGFFFFKQKTAYEMRISDWSSDVCSSDLHGITDDFGEGGVISSMEAVAARLHPVLRLHCLDRDEFLGRKGM